MSKFNTNTFITTTLPYINSKPHVGHAFEFILGDTISRYLRKKQNVQFNVGLDEHGLKVYTKSVENDIDINLYIDNLTNIWKDFCDKFEISYDSFYKTSDKSHHEKVKIVWNNFIKRGDIYKKLYKGKYCIGCESFKKDKEIINNKCIEHQNISIIDTEEENYFFKLTKYKHILLSWIDKNIDFLTPSSKIEELKYLIQESDDISISRLKKNCPWGVNVPNDDNQIIYIWFDALWSYCFSAGYLTDDFKWDNIIQLCGPDNLRFQAVILQALLESEGIKKSNKLLVHGTILDKDGKKISKSLGNVIDPIEQLEKYGLDAVKYYCLAGLSTYTDSNWNEEDLVLLFNSNICNDWGNLISRTLHLIEINSINESEILDNNFKSDIDNKVIEVEDLWNNFKIKDALAKTNLIVKFGNSYINDKKPWDKSLTKEEKSIILTNLLYLISNVNELYSPVFPTVNSFINVSLKERKKIIPFNKIK